MENLTVDDGTSMPGAVVTGAAGGIGVALAHALVAQSHPVLLVGRNEDKLRALQSALRSAHPGCFAAYVVADLNEQAGRDAIAQAVAADLRWKLLVNNAGTSEFHSFETQAVQRIEHIIQTNLVSPMLLVQQLLPSLLSRPDAQIVNIGSVFGDIGYPGFSTYCASKFGLRGFTQALRRELSDTPLRVRWFAPRATQTSMNTRAVVDMNAALKTKADTPQAVAEMFMDFLQGDRNEWVIGWPEKLFVFINRIRSAITDGAIGGQLSVIRKYMPR